MTSNHIHLIGGNKLKIGISNTLNTNFANLGIKDHWPFSKSEESLRILHEAYIFSLIDMDSQVANTASLRQKGPHLAIIRPKSELTGSNNFKKKNTMKKCIKFYQILLTPWEKRK